MLMMPRRVKFRKHQRKKCRGKAIRGSRLSFGEYGLKVLQPYLLTARQIEAARIAITREIKKGGKVWVNIFPHKSMSKKPAETRMGKGKGAPDHWVAPVKRGRIIFELAGVDKAIAQRAMMLAGHKMPIKTTFVSRS